MRTAVAAFFAAGLVGTIACASTSPYAEIHEYHNGGDQPIAASPREVWMYALDALRQRGGLPPDAILTDISGERAISADAVSAAAGHQMSYTFVWRPPAIGAEDRVMLSIGSGEITHCTQPSCSAYDVKYGLFVQMFSRKWIPASQREREQQSLRERLVPAPVPVYVKSSCAGEAVNIAALRRVAVALGEHADPLGVYRPVVERDVLSMPNSVYARFSPFIVRRIDPTLHKNEAIDIRAVAVTDYPAGGWRYIQVLSRESRSFSRMQDVWLQFIDTDQEPVCADPPHAKSLKPDLSEKGLSPAQISYDALDRSTAEAMWTRNSSKNSSPELVSNSASSNGTTVLTSLRQSDGATWLGTFWYDSQGVLRRASFSKL